MNCCKYIQKSVIVLFSVLLFSCSQTPFSIEKTTHQRVVVTENIQNTMILVYINDLQNDVNFENIVFNRQLVPVKQETDGKTTILTGFIQNGEKGIANTAQKQIDLPNQLQYNCNGKQDFILLKDIEFLPAKMR